MTYPAESQPIIYVIFNTLFIIIRW